MNRRVYGGQSSNEDVTDSARTENCVVCLQRPKNWMLWPCKHAQFCRECIEYIMETTRKCPHCRCLVERHEQIYLW